MTLKEVRPTYRSHHDNNDGGDNKKNRQRLVLGLGLIGVLALAIASSLSHKNVGDSSRAMSWQQATDKLNAATSQIELIDKQIADLKRRLAVFQSTPSLADLVKERSAVEVSIRYATRQRAALQHEIDTTSNQSNASRSAIASIQDKISDIDHQIAQMKSDLDSPVPTTDGVSTTDIEAGIQTQEKNIKTNEDDIERQKQAKAQLGMGPDEATQISDLNAQIALDQNNVNVASAQLQAYRKQLSDLEHDGNAERDSKIAELNRQRDSLYRREESLHTPPEDRKSYYERLMPEINDRVARLEKRQADLDDEIAAAEQKTDRSSSAELKAKLNTLTAQRADFKRQMEDAEGQIRSIEREAKQPA